MWELLKIAKPFLTRENEKGRCGHKKTNRTKMSGAGVGDVILLTYDVTASICPNAHASVLMYVSSFVVGMLYLTLTKTK